MGRSLIFLGVLSGAGLSIMYSCKHASTSSNSKAITTSAPTAPAGAPSKWDDFSNSAKYDPIVDDPVNPLLRDLEPITATPDHDQLEDQASNISPAQSAVTTQPLKFGALRSHKPRKFAAATVLAAMRRMRRYYFLLPFQARNTSGSPSVTIPNSMAVEPTLKSYPNFPGKVVAPLDASFDEWNTDGTGMMGGNLPAMPPFWNELQAHFYTMAPHRRHGCWTMALNAMKAGCIAVFDATPVKPENMREAIRDICTGHRAARVDLVASNPACSAWTSALGVIPQQMSAYNLMWVDPKARKFIDLPEDVRTDLVAVTDPSKVKDLKAVKWSEEQRSKGYVNVWDYIMLSQLYAFDFEQQNAVLNAFFGDHKKFSGDPTPFNPLDKADCNKFRAPRPADPIDGSQCDPNKTMLRPILSPGR